MLWSTYQYEPLFSVTNENKSPVRNCIKFLAPEKIFNVTRISGKKLKIKISAFDSEYLHEDD